MFSEEVWKDVVGFEEVYEVSSLGRVKRCTSGRIIKPSFYAAHTKKRAHYVLSYRGVRHTFRASTLVAFAFLGPRPEGHEVDHIDGNPSDDRAVNLEYVTHAENMRRAHAMGLMKQDPSTKIRGEGVANSKLTTAQVLEIRRRHAVEHASYASLGREFGVSDVSVYYIVARINWAHLPPETYAA